MQPDARAYLWAIQKAAEAIQTFTAGLDVTTYARADLVHSAVERKFEIIGEALGQLAKSHPDLALRIPDFRAVIAFRNVLIHGYAVVDHDRVLRIVEGSLPDLRDTVKRLLDELAPL